MNPLQQLWMNMETFKYDFPPRILKVKSKFGSYSIKDYFDNHIVAKITVNFLLKALATTFTLFGWYYNSKS